MKRSNHSICPLTIDSRHPHVLAGSDCIPLPAVDPSDSTFHSNLFQRTSTTACPYVRHHSTTFPLPSSPYSRIEHAHNMPARQVLTVSTTFKSPSPPQRPARCTASKVHLSSRLPRCRASKAHLSPRLLRCMAHSSKVHSVRSVLHQKLTPRSAFHAA